MANFDDFTPEQLEDFLKKSKSPSSSVGMNSSPLAGPTPAPGPLPSSASSLDQDDDISIESPEKEAERLATKRFYGLGAGIASTFPDEYSKALEEVKQKREKRRIPSQIPKELQDVFPARQYASEKLSFLDQIEKDLPEETQPAQKMAERKLSSDLEGFKPSTPLKEEDEKTSLEKSLAEASKVDLEERKKYSEILKDAIKQRDMSQLIGQLGKAGALIGSGIGGTVERGTVTKPVGGEIFDKIIDLASQPISDVEKLKAVEIEDRKNNPKSSESIAARAIMTEFGIKVPETATAAFLEKQFPSIASLTSRREAIERSKEAAKLKREEIEASRELKVGERRKELLAKEVTKLGESKPLQEQRAALDQFDAVEDKIRSFTKDPSFSFDTFKKAKYKGDLPGVSLPFAGRTTFYSPDARELDTAFQGVLNQAIRSFAGKAVTKNELERIRTQYEAGKFANEKDYLQAFADVKKAVKKGIQSGEKAFSKEALEEYESRGGRVLSLGEKTESKSLKQKNPQVQKYADEHFGGDYDKALEFLEKRRKR